MKLIFSHQACGNQNPFSGTNSNKGKPKVNIFFPIDKHDRCIRMDVDMTPNAKWLHHVSFDKLG
jgi:hypothetical protein